MAPHWSLLSKETGKTYSAYGFKTFTLPYFTESHSIWYVKVDGKNVKVIPSNFADLITPISLAYWVSGDGSYNKRYGCIGIATHSFLLPRLISYALYWRIAMVLNPLILLIIKLRSSTLYGSPKVKLPKYSHWYLYIFLLLCVTV
jgi:hypothetical protein